MESTEDIEYGRRIDLLVTGDGLDANGQDIELCSFELKKETISESVFSSPKRKAGSSDLNSIVRKPTSEKIIQIFQVDRETIQFTND